MTNKNTNTIELLSDLHDIFCPEIFTAVSGNCTCGHPLLKPYDILKGNFSYICPKCGKDNEPIYYEGDDEE